MDLEEFKELGDDEVPMGVSKYKVFTVKTDIEEDYKVFSDDIEEVKKWVIDKYKDDNPEKLSIKFIYSTDDIENARDMGKEINIEN